MSIAARTDRSIIRMYGRDPLKMIQGLATNDIAGADVDQSVYTGFLTPKGKLVGDARVARRANGDVWIEADSAAAANIVANLKKFVPPLFARFETMQGVALFEFIGEPAAEGAELLLANPFRPDSVTGVYPANTTIEPTLTQAQLEEIRVAAGEPRWGAELTEDVIPIEAGLRHVAISETKGCYTGQEVIIRILHRGHVNRHLRRLQFESNAAPAVGSEIHYDGKNVGRITSAANAAALGYVRREVAIGSMVDVAGEPAQVALLPWQERNT